MSSSELTSKDIEANVQSLMRNIKNIHKLSVIGFMRNNALEINNLNIPSSIISYIIVYIYALFEVFDTENNFAELPIEDHQMKVSFVRTDKWQNIFGSTLIQKSTGIHEWIFEVYTERPWMIIGLVPFDVIDKHSQELWMEKSKDLMYTNWMVNDFWKGVGLHLGTGDFMYDADTWMCQVNDDWTWNTAKSVVKMIFNSDKYNLVYFINDVEVVHERHAMGQLRAQPYKMAISSVVKAAIHLISYNRYNCTKDVNDKFPCKY